MTGSGGRQASSVKDLTRLSVRGVFMILNLSANACGLDLWRPELPLTSLEQLTCFELLRPEGEISQTKAITPDALKIMRTEVDPRGVFTTMPTTQMN